MVRPCEMEDTWVGWTRHSPAIRTDNEDSRHTGGGEAIQAIDEMRAPVVESIMLRRDDGQRLGFGTRGSAAYR